MTSHVEKLGSKYQPDIDGLRAFAVLSVVINHYWPNLLTGGFVGVDIFFVISGYIITKLVSSEIYNKDFSIVNFYIRRIKRIIPVLLIVLFISILTSFYIMLPSDSLDTIHGSIATILFSANFLYWKELQSGYFAAMDTGIHPLVHTWSLAVEEQFYIFFPIFLIFALKLKNKNILNITLFLFIFASIILSEYNINNHSVAVFFLSPFRFWELLIGVIISLNIKNLYFNKYFAEFLSISGFLILIHSIFNYNNSTVFPGLNAVLPLLGTSLIIITCYSNGLLFKSTIISYVFSIKPLVFIGLISYSLYLIHWPIFSIYRYSVGLKELSDVSKLFILLFSLGLSFLSFKYIEQFFRGIRVIRYNLFMACTFLIIFSFIGFCLFMANRINILDSNINYVAYDKQRFPEIEYKKCDSIKDEKKWCIVGNNEIKPSHIILGDSHLISWAFAFNEALIKKNESAFIAPFSACPPLVGIKKSLTKGCSERSELIEKLIINSDIDTFIITGNWIHHFTKTIINDNLESENIPHAFNKTINLLKENNKKVIIIGPVPIYENNVPLILGIESKKNQSQSSLNLNIQNEQLKIERFYSSINSHLLSDESIIFYDPLAKLCTPLCLNMINNKSIYFDSNHLNNLGASLFVDDFIKILDH